MSNIAIDAFCKFVSALLNFSVTKYSPRIEFAILFFVKPGATDIEETQTWHKLGQRQRVDRELGERLVRADIGFVVEDVHGAVAHLQEVDVAGDRLVGRLVAGVKPDPMLAFQGSDVARREPDRHLDSERYGIVRKQFWKDLGQSACTGG